MAGQTKGEVEMREVALSTSSSTRSIPGSVVDVDAAVQEFRKLESSVHAEQRQQDVEKGGADWDIQEFFEDSVRKGEETGHKLKRMGVIVKNLSVVGMGADAASIPDNLDMLKALWPPTWYVHTPCSLPL
jgi:hypothetical protein